MFPLQIYIFYGTRANAEFVIHNGFFYQDNAHDQVKIKLGISKSERLYAMKAEVLGRAGIPVYVPLSSLIPSIVRALLMLQELGLSCSSVSEQFNPGPFKRVTFAVFVLDLRSH